MIADPKELPTLCEFPISGMWPFECWQSFVAFEEIAVGNTGIAESNTTALRKSDAAYDHLYEAARLQQQLAQIREEMLERERTARTQDKWYYRILIGLGILGATL